MSKEYLDKNGLAHYDAKIKQYIDGKSGGAKLYMHNVIVGSWNGVFSWIDSDPTERNVQYIMDNIAFNPTGYEEFKKLRGRVWFEHNGQSIAGMVQWIFYLGEEEEWHVSTTNGTHTYPAGTPLTSTDIVTEA